MEVVIWDRKGPQQAQCHFKDYEVGGNCIVLFIVLCLLGGGAFIQFLWPKCLLSLGAIVGGDKNQGFHVYLPRK